MEISLKRMIKNRRVVLRPLISLSLSPDNCHVVSGSKSYVYMREAKFKENVKLANAPQRTLTSPIIRTELGRADRAGKVHRVREQGL
jgi:hypothetical protein